MKRPIKPTATNLFVLRRCFPAGVTAIANRIEAGSAPHIRRCVDAGLVEPMGATLVLTAAGREALA